MLCVEETASVFKDDGATSVKLDGRAATVLDDFADDCQIVGCSLSVPDSSSVGCWTSEIAVP